MTKLRRAMTLIGFLDDRATFVACYADALALRLLERSSLSIALERGAISMLKSLAPYEHATKLQRMVLDESASRELNDVFRDHASRHASRYAPLPLRLGGAHLPSFLGIRREAPSAAQAKKAREEDGGGGNDEYDDDGEYDEGEEGVGSSSSAAADMAWAKDRNGAGGEPIEMEVLVLTAGAWPSSLPHAIPGPLPACVEALRRRFETFYVERHASRKLVWAHAMSTVDVAARFAKGAPLLRVSPAQLALLLPFRRGTSARSLTRLAKASRLHAGAFTVALLALLRSGILECDGVASATGPPGGGTPPLMLAAAERGVAGVHRQAGPSALAAGQASPSSPPSSSANPPPDPDAVAAAAASAIGLPPTPSPAASAVVRLNLDWDPYEFGCLGSPGSGQDTPSSSASSSGASASAFSPKNRHASTLLVSLHTISSGFDPEGGRRGSSSSANGGRGPAATSDDLKVLVQAAIVRTLKRAGEAPRTRPAATPACDHHVLSLTLVMHPSPLSLCLCCLASRAHGACGLDEGAEQDPGPSDEARPSSSAPLR